MKKILSLCLLLLISFSVVAAEYPPLRILTSFKIKSFDPVKQGFWYSEFGSAELLMKWDRDFNIVPWVLESLEQVDDLNWKLTLRHNVTFQNGKRLTAKALVAMMNRQLELSSAAKANLPNAKLKIADENTVILTTQKLLPTVPNIFASEGVFPVYDVEAVEAVGSHFEKLGGKGFYTGPYAPVKLNDKELVLERYDGYWQGRPPLPGVTVRFVVDPQAKILAVQNGEADIALYIPSESKKILQGRNDAYFVTAPSTRGAVRLIFNQKIPPFNDKNVRKAFGLAIDYESMANQVLEGVYKVAVGYYPEGFSWLVKNQITDVELAKTLLEKNGWKLGEGNVRTKNGVKLKTNLLIYPSQPDLVPMSIAMQEQLREIGFDIEIQSVDSLDDTIKNDLIPWNTALTYSGTISGGGATQLHRYMATNGDRNHGGLSDNKLDALIEELDSTFDSQSRHKLLKEIQEIIIEKEAYQFIIANKLFPAVVSPAYRNYQPSHNWDHVSFETHPMN